MLLEVAAAAAVALAVGAAAPWAGLDGGTIISRTDVLRGQSWDVACADDTHSTRGGSVGLSKVFKKRKLDAATERATRFTTCPLSSEPLVAPVVCDYLGTLYSKAAVLEWLLARGGAFASEAAGHRYLNQLRESGGAFDHLTSSKDVFDVQLSAEQLGVAPPVCPITDLSAAKAQFVALVPCGHVMSERALKQVGSDACPLCSAHYDAPPDVLTLLPSGEALEALRSQLPERAAQRRQHKKRRRGEKAAGEQQAAGAAAAAAAASLPPQPAAAAVANPP